LATEGKFKARHHRLRAELGKNLVLVLGLSCATAPPSEIPVTRGLVEFSRRVWDQLAADYASFLAVSGSAFLLVLVSSLSLVLSV